MSNALIFVAQGVQDQEFFYPYYRLKEEGFHTVDVVASGKINPYDTKILPWDLSITGKYNIPIKCTYRPDKLTLDDFYDLVIIPGGWQAPEIMRQDKKILEYLQYIDTNHKNIVIGSICHGPQVLISAKICSGKQMTCYKGMKDDLINAGAEYIDAPVVTYDNFITSPHYDNNPDFMREILRVMKNYV